MAPYIHRQVGGPLYSDRANGPRHSKTHCRDVGHERVVWGRLCLLSNALGGQGIRVCSAVLDNDQDTEPAFRRPIADDFARIYTTGMHRRDLWLAVQADITDTM